MEPVLMSILTITDLCYKHATDLILNNAKLSLSKGEVVGILGINGAGKTTLFDLICDIKKPTTGTIVRSTKNQAYLTQIISSPPLLSMQEIRTLVTELNTHHGSKTPQIESSLERWSPKLLERYLGIAKKKAASCSYGEIRSFLALTILALKSDVIILDEPTAGVDPEFRHYIWLGIKRVCNEGSSVLVSSHHTEEVANHCDRFYMLAYGELKAFCDTKDFLAHYQANNLEEAFINASIRR